MIMKNKNPEIIFISFCIHVKVLIRNKDFSNINIKLKVLEDRTRTLDDIRSLIEIRIVISLCKN